MERVADYIIEKLTQIGIKHIFLITGRGILYLTDAVAKNPNVIGIPTFHEQGASYAAMAYAAASNGMSACIVSTGCAATNAVTAALCAFQDNLPCIFISGQHMLTETTRYTGIKIRTFGSQEADIVSIVEPITKYAVMIEEPERICYEMEKAIHIANEGRKGPVWLDVPIDIQNARIDTEKLLHYNSKKEIHTASEDEVDYVLQHLEKAERPLMLVGGGVRTAEAIDELRIFIEKNEIPVVFTASAADIYGTGNRFSIGAVGSLGGSRAGNFAVQNADYVLAIGTRLCSQTIGADTDLFARSASITVIDIDKDEHIKGKDKINKLIISDAKTFLTDLNNKGKVKKHDIWINKCFLWKEKFEIKNEKFVHDNINRNTIDLYYFSDVLSQNLHSQATVITDAGFEELIIPSTVKFYRHQRCLFPAAQGAMGYAVPAILGAYFAGKKDIVVVVGDGSIMMNIQELLVISNQNIPSKIFVINNNMYAVIRKRQQDLFRKRTIGTDSTNGVFSPDFRKIAVSFGFEYEKISNLSELNMGIQRVLNMDGPCLCEVMCIEEQPYLHTSYGFDSRRKLVKRSLEDLSPFLERDVIKSEMIIPMIEE